MAKFYISMVSVALQIGAKAFAGKMDKTGREPAFWHSLRVEAAVARTGAGEIAQAAALLHDVVEDTSVTVDDIRWEFKSNSTETYPKGWVDDLIDAILSVTRGYIRRDTREMVFSPPPPTQVCNCRWTKMHGGCDGNPAHVFDKETYRNFIMRSKRHPLGRIIKIADIVDNMSPTRREGLPEDEVGIVEERYAPALAFLKDSKATEYFTPRQLARLCRRCSMPFSEHAGNTPTCPGKQLFPDPQRSVFKGVR